MSIPEIALSQPCPCGLSATLAACCGRFITGEFFPETAEQLMRSRYSAYTLAQIDYIVATQIDEKKHFDSDSARRWATAAKWKKLRVLNSSNDPSDPNTAFVEFVAAYIWQGKLEKLTENSQFKKIKGKWYYLLLK